MTDDHQFVYLIPDGSETRSPLTAALWWLRADRPRAPAPALFVGLRPALAATGPVGMPMLADPASLLGSAREEAGIVACPNCQGAGQHQTPAPATKQHAHKPSACAPCSGQGHTGSVPADHPLFIAEAEWILARLPGNEPPDEGHWQKAARAWARLGQPALLPSIGRARGHAGNWTASLAFTTELQALNATQAAPNLAPATVVTDQIVADWAVVQAAAPYVPGAAGRAITLLQQLAAHPSAAQPSAAQTTRADQDGDSGPDARVVTALTICSLANPSPGAAESAEILRRATTASAPTSSDPRSAVLEAVVPALNPSAAPGQHSASALLQRLAEAAAAAHRARGTAAHPRLLHDQDRTADALRNALLGSAAVLLSRQRSDQVIEQAATTNATRQNHTPGAPVHRQDPPTPGNPGRGPASPGR